MDILTDTPPEGRMMSTTEPIPDQRNVIQSITTITPPIRTVVIQAMALEEDDGSVSAVHWLWPVLAIETRLVEQWHKWADPKASYERFQESPTELLSRGYRCTGQDTEYWAIFIESDPDGDNWIRQIEINSHQVEFSYIVVPCVWAIEKDDEFLKPFIETAKRQMIRRAEDESKQEAEKQKEQPHAGR